MKTLGSRFLIMTALLVGAAGCGEEAEPVEADLEVLNQRLEALVEAQGGAAALTLPDSDDLAAIPQDPNNPLTFEKIELGKILFHDARLGVKPKRGPGAGTYSCASCHAAEAGFQAGVKQGIGEGGVGLGARRDKDPGYLASELDVQPIRTPSAMNGAWQPNQLWNGQFGGTHDNEGTEEAWIEGKPTEANWLGFEGLETQAIAGQDVHRLSVSEGAQSVVHDPEIVAMFEAAFPEVAEGEALVTRERAGLAIAAYERALLSNRAPFQRWLRGERGAMDAASLRGAALFFGEAGCAACHSGPALNSPKFYALGMGDLDAEGTYGDGPDTTARLGRGGFTKRLGDEYCFKVPQLYNLTDARFLGHGATFQSVREVIEYKNRAVPENPNVPVNKLSDRFVPLGLSQQEIDDLSTFVASALRDPELRRYQP
jgi:cytochrome c peroxidase